MLSGRLYEYFLLLVDWVEVGLLVSKQQRLLVTESEDSEGAKTVIEKIHHFVLKPLIEIYQHIAAKDQLKFVKGLITGQIVRSEYDVVAQAAVKERGIVLGNVILREITFATGLDVVSRIRFHQVQRKDALLCLNQ